MEKPSEALDSKFIPKMGQIQASPNAKCVVVRQEYKREHDAPGQQQRPMTCRFARASRDVMQYGLSVLMKKPSEALGSKFILKVGPIQAPQIYNARLFVMNTDVSTMPLAIN